jgi:hypothetical protein
MIYPEMKTFHWAMQMFYRVMETVYLAMCMKYPRIQPFLAVLVSVEM